MRRKKGKLRLLSLLLSAVMVCTMLPVIALAEEDETIPVETTGEEVTPVRMDGTGDLLNIVINFEDDTNTIVRDRWSGSYNIPYLEVKMTDQDGLLYSSSLFDVVSSDENSVRASYNESGQWYIEALAVTVNGPVTVTATHKTDANLTASIQVNVDYFPYGYDPVPVISSNYYVGSTVSCEPGYSVTKNAEYTYQWWRCDYDGTNREDIAGATGTEYTLTESDKGKYIGADITVAAEGKTWSTKNPLGAIIEDPRLPLSQSNINQYAEAVAKPDADGNYYEDYRFRMTEDITLSRDFIAKNFVEIDFEDHTLTISDGCYFGPAGGQQMMIWNLGLHENYVTPAKPKLIGKLSSDAQSDLEIGGLDFTKTDWSDCYANHIMLSGGIYSFDPWNPLDPKYPQHTEFSFIGGEPMVYPTYEYGNGTGPVLIYMLGENVDPNPRQTLLNRHTYVDTSKSKVGDELTASTGWYSFPEIGEKEYHIEWRRQTEARSAYSLSVDAVKAGSKIAEGNKYTITTADFGKYLVADIITDDGTFGYAGYSVVGPVTAETDDYIMIGGGGALVETTAVDSDKFTDGDGAADEALKKDISRIAETVTVSGLEDIAIANAEKATAMISKIKAATASELKEMIGSRNLESFISITKIDPDAADFDAAKLNVAVQPAVKVTPVGASRKEGSRSFTLDIKPVLCTVIAQTGVAAGDIRTDNSGYYGPNAVVVGESQELQVTTPVTVNMHTPNLFCDQNRVPNISQIFIKHTHGDGQIDYYEGTLPDNAWKIRFVSEEGFSTFEISEKNTNDSVYTVTFDLQGQGTAVAPYTGIAYGAKIAKPADPTASGYKFVNWYKEAACTNEWNFENDTVKKNITLYAKWQQEEVKPVETAAATVGTESYTEAQSSEAVKKAIESGAVLELLKDFTATVSTEGTLTVKKNGHNCTITAGTGFQLSGDPVEKDGNLVYTIVKEAPPAPPVYTVTFQLQGHGAAIAPYTGIASDSKIPKPADPAESGYEFQGWYEDAAFTNEWDFENDTVKADTVLYAKWIKDTNTETPEDVDDTFYGESVVRTDLASVNGKIAKIKDKVYDGSPYMPAVKVTISNGGKSVTLTEGTDYRVLYEKNVNVGSGKVIVKGNGIYTGEISETFKITPKPLSKLKVVAGGMALDSAEEVPVYVYDGSKLLMNGSDYTLTPVDTSSKGKKNVTVTAAEKSNYSGSKTVTVMVYDGDKILELDDVELEYSSAVYTGRALKPAVKVQFEGEDLDKKYYTVKYSNNKNAGTAYVTITGKKGYNGNVVKTFEITPLKTAFELGKKISDVTYNGKLQKPSVVIKSDGKTLKAGKDYVIYYSNNLHATEGSKKAIVTVKGMGNYEGAPTATFDFTILPRKIGKVTVKGKKDSLTLTYAKRTLLLGTDYTATYGEVKKGKVEVTLEGLKDFTGTVKKKVKQP